VECMRTRRGAYRLLVARPKGRRQRGSPRRRWESNITIDLRETVWDIGLSGSGSG
jgi:hypothetical protein